MKTIIFGGSGFVGRALSRALTGNIVSLSSEILDLADNNFIKIIENIVEDGDNIVMLSVLTQEKGNPRDTTLKNIMMARNLLAGIESKKLNHFVYVSSDSVYGRAWENIDESTPVCPDTLYGHMHAMRELYFSGYFPNLTILRPCAIYGVGDTHNSYGINRFIREAKKHGEISLFGEGEEYRSNIHVDDVASIISLALKNKISGTFNAVSSKSWRFSEIAEIISKYIPCRILYKDRTTPITHRFFDNSALVHEFIDPRSADIGIRQILNPET